MVLYDYLKLRKSSYITQLWASDLQGLVSLQPHRGQIFHVLVLCISYIMNVLVKF